MAKKTNNHSKEWNATVPTRSSGQSISQKPDRAEQTVSRGEPFPSIPKPGQAYTFHGDDRIKTNDATLKPS